MTTFRIFSYRNWHPHWFWFPILKWVGRLFNLDWYFLTISTQKYQTVDPAIKED